MLFHSISTHAPPPPPPQDTRLFSYSLKLTHAHGDVASLASLSGSGGGFRQYIVSHATEIGVTGTIPRYHHCDVIVCFEGRELQLDEFFYFLHNCLGQGMFDNIVRLDERLHLDPLLPPLWLSSGVVVTPPRCCT